MLIVAAAACGQSSDEGTPAAGSGGKLGAITGFVTDIEGQPVAGMRVGIVSGTAAYPEIAPETDEGGSYRINSVPPGSFEVAVHDRDGHRIGLASVIVTSGEMASRNFSVSLGVADLQNQAAAATLISIPATTKEPTDGLCLPAVSLAVSVGDTWTISGPVKTPEGFPTELPLGATEVSTTFTVDAIGTTAYSGGQSVAPIDDHTVQLQVTNVTGDAYGNILSTEADPRVARGGWTPVSVKNVGPVLTPDWECHESAWLNGWPPNAQPSIGERVLSSGLTAVVFTVRLPLLLPDLGIDGTTERHHGYDRLTGREVLREVRHTGTRNGAPFNMEMLMARELAEAEPISDAPPVIPGGAPRVFLTYEGAVYYQNPLTDDQAAKLNKNDLELVGATTESNLLLPAGSEIRRFIVALNHDFPELTVPEIKDRVEADWSRPVKWCKSTSSC